MKTSYTFIRYIPVDGVKTSATSAVRHEVSVIKAEQIFLLLLNQYERELPACNDQVAPDLGNETNRYNDTSLRSWRRTRQRLDSYGADQQSAV